MVEREQFKLLVKGMKAVYPQTTFIPDQDAFVVWYSLLQDIDYEILSQAIQKHMMTSKFPPTIADIREAAAQFMPQEKDLTELEAWGLVRRAICNSTYHAEEEFEKLPEAVQRAVGSPANLREWGQMDVDTVESVEASHFVRNYRVMKEREKEMQRLPEAVRNKLQLIQSQETVHSVPEKKKEVIEERTQGTGIPENVREKLDELLGRK